MHPHTIKPIFRSEREQIRWGVVLFVVFSPNVNTVVCTKNNLTFIWKYYFFPVVVYCSTSSLFTPLDSLFSSRFPNHHFLFRLPSFISFQHPLHGFLAEGLCFALVQLCSNVLLLLTKRFKTFLSLFVKLFFLPLRVKVYTVPVLRYLPRTLEIVVLGMFNSLDSSALFCTDCDRVTINSLVSVDSWAPFRLMRTKH